MAFIIAFVFVMLHIHIILDRVVQNYKTTVKFMARLMCFHQAPHRLHGKDGLWKVVIKCFIFLCLFFFF